MRWTALLLLAGCLKNVDELEAARRGAALELAEQSRLHEQLADRQQELAKLEGVIADAEAELKTLGWDGNGLTPLTPGARRIRVPAVSRWEGSQARRLREEIKDTQRRIDELAEQNGKVAGINRYRKRTEEALTLLQRMRDQARPAP